MLNNYDIERGFLKREDIDKLLTDFSTRVDVIDNMDTEGKVRASMMKGVNKVIATKLKIAFQRQIQLDFKEAMQYYNSHVEELYERVNMLYDIVDFVNDLEVSYIPDKLTVASYFRVSGEVFESLMSDAQVESEVQRAFLAVNEFVLSLTQIGLETGALNSYAWNRLQLKTKYGGHAVQKASSGESKPIIIASNDIQRKLASDYDFAKLLGEQGSFDDSNDDNNK